MSRKTISKNISLDEERKPYYVCLNWGKGEDGKYVKTYFTTDNICIKKSGTPFAPHLPFRNLSQAYPS